MSFFKSMGLLLFLLQSVTAATCNLKPSYQSPVLASGWSANIVAQDLKSPRSLLFDSNGGLLVVEQGHGVVHLQLDDGGGTCVDVFKKTYLINSTDLNHGLALSQSSSTLYASSADSVFSWPYDALVPSISSPQTTLITNMSNSDHTTRTLVLSRSDPNILLVSRGSNDNIDPLASSLSSGHSQIRAFDISAFTGPNENNNTTTMPAETIALDFNTAGHLLGWGLRNSVGVAEHPITRGIFSVENSADQLERAGQDIHQDNPGEELNYHGVLVPVPSNGSAALSVTDAPAPSASNASSPRDGRAGNYGYPECFAAWDVDALPQNENLSIGAQFVLDPSSDDVDAKEMSDLGCEQLRVAPRLTFQAHMAPLDLTFVPDGSLAYITFHGSWDRSSPAGYKLSSIVYDASTGQPEAASTSIDALRDIMTNRDLSDCPNACFRPVAVVLDGMGRLWMTSDATGEIWVLQRSGEDGGNGAGGAGTEENGAGAREVSWVGLSLMCLLGLASSVGCL